MFARRWITFVLLVLWVVRTKCINSESKDHPQKDINQSDAEFALNIQTILRRHLIKSLAKIREKIDRFDDLFSMVSTVIQGLQTRDVNPFQLFKNDDFIHKNQSFIFQPAEIMYDLQYGNYEENILLEWNFLLETVPNVSVVIPPLPSMESIPENVKGIKEIKKHHIFKVLADVQKNYLKPNKNLLANLLYNYRFRDHSAELEMILDSFIQLLKSSEIDFVNFRTDPEAVKQPNEILSGILQYILGIRHFDSDLAYQTTRLLSALSNTVNNQKVLGLFGLFDLMLVDDYPQDIITAKNDLGYAIKTDQVGLNLTLVAESLEGYSPTEKLLGLIAKLTLLPSENPLSRKVRAIYPHVKLKFLSSREKFFQPQTPSDVAFLLNSFLSLPSQINPFLITEIHKIFLLPNFNWKEVLENFEYSLYGKPRPLILGMLQKLLTDSNNLPAPALIAFNYFLLINRQILFCSAFEPKDIFFNEKLNIPETTVKNFPDTEIRGSLTLSKNVKTTVASPFATMKKCSDGPSVELIDPESIIEILSSSHCTDFIIDLIRYSPMPVEKYSSKARVDVFKKVLGNLKNNIYNDDISAFVQALAKTPLNEKANLPPKFIRVCPSELSRMNAEAPMRKQKMKDLKFKAVIDILKASTTTRSPIVKQLQVYPPNSLIPKTPSEKTTKGMNQFNFSPTSEQVSRTISINPSITPLSFLTTPPLLSLAVLSTLRSPTALPSFLPTSSFKRPAKTIFNSPPPSLPSPIHTAISSLHLAHSTTSTSSSSETIRLKPTQSFVTYNPVIPHSPDLATVTPSTFFSTGETNPLSSPSTEKLSC